jgi:hypothetical protein
MTDLIIILFEGVKSISSLYTKHNVINQEISDFGYADVELEYCIECTKYIE